MRHLILSFSLIFFLLPTTTSHAAENPATTNTTTQTDKKTVMTPVQAAILGIVEGLTEYLPVSSTGHLIVTAQFMDIGNNSIEEKTAIDAFTIAVQAGAILAVLGLYFHRVKSMTLGLLGKDKDGLRLAIRMLVAFTPAAILGLALSGLIKEYLFGLWPVVFAWIVGGIAILVVCKLRPRNPATVEQGLSLQELTIKAALIIGLLQCIAMWPGTSRSLMTIVGGLLVGLRLSSAVEFSFLLGVLTLGVATAKDTMDNGPLMLQTFGASSLIIGFVCATLSAAVAVKWMVGYLRTHGLQIFGYYRIAIGLIVAFLIIIEVFPESL